MTWSDLCGQKWVKREYESKTGEGREKQIVEFHGLWGRLEVVRSLICYNYDGWANMSPVLRIQAGSNKKRIYLEVYCHRVRSLQALLSATHWGINRRRAYWWRHEWWLGRIHDSLKQFCSDNVWTYLLIHCDSELNLLNVSHSCEDCCGKKNCSKSISVNKIVKTKIVIRC